MAPLQPLRRSQINQSLAEATAGFARFGIHLPPFAAWPTAEWTAKGHEGDEIRDCMLGWDVTDFGSGRFTEIGRVLFTLRNGSVRKPGYPKTYAEKLLFDPESQRAPAHYHRSKNEDICCRAGGNILVKLDGLGSDGQRSGRPLAIRIDGWNTTIGPGEIVRLKPGMSVNIPPGTIHQFWGEEGTGITVSSEVSSVCDDWDDNVFLEPSERFPSINEDAAPTHFLCHEYPAAR